MITGHPAEAINETRQAVLLDPLAPLFRAGLAEVLALTGQRDDAVKQLKAVFEMDPHLAVAHGSMGKIYTQEGRYREAIGEFQTEARLDGHANLEMIGYAYGVWGKRKEALRTLSQLQQSGAGPAGQAIVELGLGQKEKAIPSVQSHDSRIFCSV